MSEYSLAQQCKVFFTLKKINECRDFPGSPVAKTPNAGGPGSIPAWGTISHILQLRVRIYHNEDWRFCVLQLRPGAAKWINKYLKKKKNNSECNSPHWENKGYKSYHLIRFRKNIWPQHPFMIKKKIKETS